MASSPKSQAQAIDEAKDNASEIDIQQLETTAYPLIVDALESSFDFVRGAIVVGAAFIKQLNIFTNKIAAALRIEPKFIGAVSGVVKRIPQIKDAIDEFQKTQGITTVKDNVASKLIEETLKEAILREGLNQHFIQPLRDLVHRDAMGGLTLKGAKELIKDYVKSGKDQSGKLKSYVQQTAQQAVDAYTGMVSMKLMQEFKYDGLLMTGSLIDTSAPQCVYAINELGGIITRADWPKLKKIAEKHGLIDNTTFDNLPVNQLHWGCRHSFYPFVKN